jgi:hypothetical protein
LSVILNCLSSIFSMTVSIEVFKAVFSRCFQGGFRVVCLANSGWSADADMEKVAASGHLVPRRKLGRRRILGLITAFVTKITAKGFTEGFAEG